MFKSILFILIQLFLITWKVSAAPKFTTNVDPVIVEDVSFIKLGTYSKTEKLK